MRSQMMSCGPCSQLIATTNIRVLVSQAASMLPKEIRRQVRLHFRTMFQQFFDGLLDTRKIEPSHIFDLQMLRARASGLKCSLRSGHPRLGECSDLAYVEVNTGGGWAKSCMLCATSALGLDEIREIILHPRIRNLRGT